MTNDFILQDRLQKINQIITEYGQENFYLSFSGGLDSTVLHHLIDMAVPNNNIPRVYCNTGIELNMIKNFVETLAKNDSRIIIIKPKQNIKTILKEHGYPFKSKRHSKILNQYQRGVEGVTPHNYIQDEQATRNLSGQRVCPKKLKYQFSKEFNLKVSDKCCKYLKEKPLDEWAKENGKKYAIIGIMPDEGGRRESAKCLAFTGKNLKAFQPLVPVTKDWEKWFIEKYNIPICDIYKEPYNFTRTGCKGCPFTIKLQQNLETLEKYFPTERKQCEIIWKEVYEEYRRIGYRLKGESEK